MPEQQQNQGYKISKWMRLVVTIAILFVIGLGIVWILNTLSIIPKPLSDNVSKLLASIFGLFAIIFGTIFDKDTRQLILRRALNISSEEKKTTDTPQVAQDQGASIPNITFSPTVTVSPSITLSPNQNISLSSFSNEISGRLTNSEISQSDGLIKPLGKDVSARVKTSPEAEHPLPNPDSVFLFNVRLIEPSEFYGRARERRTLIQRSQYGASTSIVGPYRIGKTWLISYLRLLAEASALGSRIRIGYLQGTARSSANLAGFTSKSIEALGVSILNQDPSLIGLDKLELAVEQLKSKNLIPILCIDEFEGLCSRPEFNLDFLENLRSIAESGLGLVVTSKRPLIDIVVDIVGEHGRTSPFFNIFEQLTLKPFNDEEAQKFAEDKSSQAGFTHQERNNLLQYGRKNSEEWLPLRLQLTGKLLLEDKNLALTESSHYYRPDDLSYWRDFQNRLEEKYRVVVG